jgi:hypothetical protein
MIYFVQADVGGPVKIGYTSAASVAGRLAQMQCGSPFRLRAIATQPGSQQVERELHLRFAHLREHGEWFRPDPELVTFIGGEVNPRVEIIGPPPLAPQSRDAPRAAHYWHGPLFEHHQRVLDALDTRQWRRAGDVSSVVGASAQRAAGLLSTLHRLGRAEKRRTIFPNPAGTGSTLNEWRAVR